MTPPESGRVSRRGDLHVQLVLTFVCHNRCRWRDDEVRFVPATYERIADELELDRYGVNQALDDLYALGLIDAHLSGLTQVVTPLSTQIEEVA